MRPRQSCQPPSSSPATFPVWTWLLLCHSPLRSRHPHAVPLRSRACLRQTWWRPMCARHQCKRCTTAHRISLGSSLNEAYTQLTLALKNWSRVHWLHINMLSAHDVPDHCDILCWLKPCTHIFLVNILLSLIKRALETFLFQCQVPTLEAKWHP